MLYNLYILEGSCFYQERTNKAIEMMQDIRLHKHMYVYIYMYEKHDENSMMSWSTNFISTIIKDNKFSETLSPSSVVQC